MPRSHVTSRARRVVAVVALLAIAGPVRADELTLSNGDVLRGTIIEYRADSILFEHPALGTMDVPRERIASVVDSEEGPTPAQVEAERPAPLRPEPGPGAASAPAPTSADEATTDAEAVVGPEVPELPPGSVSEAPERDWTLRFIVGGSLSNDDGGEKVKLNLSGRWQRETERRRTTVAARWYYELKGSAVDENYAWIGGDTRWLNPDSPWFVLAQARFDYDEFRDWEYRGTAHGALGYELLKDPKLNLNGLLGAGLRKDFGTDDEELLLEGLVGVELRWIPSRRQELDTSLVWYPALTGDRTRYVSSVSWSYLLDLESRLSFNVSLEYEYDTSPDSGFPNNVYYLNFGLQWDY